MAWFDLCFGRKSPLAYREIRLGSSVNKEYAQIRRNFASNTVVTSKYNFFTFLPRFAPLLALLTILDHSSSNFED
jgi:hypothetical protein